MISRLHPNFLLIPIILITLLTFWIDHMAESLETASNDNFHRPDYIVKGVSGIQMNYDSSIHSTFIAKKMMHYEYRELTKLERPYFVNVEPGKPTIRLKADNAELFSKGENIYLTGNVVVLRESGDSVITMETNYLHLIPEENIVKTDGMVTIKDKNTTITAVGLELNNYTGIVQLFSQVRATDN